MVPNMWFHPLNQLVVPIGWSTSAAWHLASSAQHRREENVAPGSAVETWEVQHLSVGIFLIFSAGVWYVEICWVCWNRSFSGSSCPIMSHHFLWKINDFGMVLWYHHRLGPWWSPGTGRHVMCWHSSVLGASMTKWIKWWIGEGFFLSWGNLASSTSREGAV